MHYYTTRFFTVKLKLVPLFSAAAAPEQEKDEDSNACTDTNCKILEKREMSNMVSS